MGNKVSHLAKFHCSSSHGFCFHNTLLLRTDRPKHLCKFPLSSANFRALHILRSSFVIHHKVSVSISWVKVLWHTITKFFKGIRTDVLYSHIGYDVTNYFWSEVRPKENKTVKNTASVGFGLNFSLTVKARITQFYTLIGDNQPQNLPDMTSLAASGRVVNAIKYCAKVCKTGCLNSYLFTIMQRCNHRYTSSSMFRGILATYRINIVINVVMTTDFVYYLFINCALLIR